MREMQCSPENPLLPPLPPPTSYELCSPCFGHIAEVVVSTVLTCPDQGPIGALAPLTADHQINHTAGKPLPSRASCGLPSLAQYGKPVRPPNQCLQRSLAERERCAGLVFWGSHDAACSGGASKDTSWVAVGTNATLRACHPLAIQQMGNFKPGRRKAAVDYGFLYRSCFCAMCRAGDEVLVRR